MADKAGELARLVDTAGREAQVVVDLRRDVERLLQVWQAQADLAGLSTEELRAAVATRTARLDGLSVVQGLGEGR